MCLPNLYRKLRLLIIRINVALELLGDNFMFKMIIIVAAQLHVYILRVRIVSSVCFRIKGLGPCLKSLFISPRFFRHPWKMNLAYKSFYPFTVDLVNALFPFM